MGHDDPLSIVDDYGPYSVSPLKLDNLSDEMLSNLAFFFGGVGDGVCLVPSHDQALMSWVKLVTSTRLSLGFNVRSGDSAPPAVRKPKFTSPCRMSTLQSSVAT